MLRKAKYREGNDLLLEAASDPLSQQLILKAWSSALSIPVQATAAVCLPQSRPEIPQDHPSASGVWEGMANHRSSPVHSLRQFWASCMAEKFSPSREHLHWAVNVIKKPFVGRAFTAEALSWQRP